MAPVVTRFDKHSGKLLVAFWLFVIVAGLALLEWSLTPNNGRYKAYGNASGPGPERRLMMREWEPNTDYRFAPPQPSVGAMQRAGCVRSTTWGRTRRASSSPPDAMTSRM